MFSSESRLVMYAVAEVFSSLDEELGIEQQENEVLLKLVNSAEEVWLLKWLKLL